MMDYDELVTRIRLSFIEKCILKISKVAQANASKIIEKYDKTLEERAELKELLELVESDFNQIANYSLDRALTGTVEIPERKKHKYSLKEYKKKNYIYSHVNHDNEDLWLWEKERYSHYNALRLLWSLHVDFNCGYEGVIFCIASEYCNVNIDKIKEEAVRRNSDEILIFSEHGIDDYAIMFDKFAGAVVSKKCQINDVVKFIEQNLSKISLTNLYCIPF